MQIEEILIKIPYGHITAKWWGPKNIRPIVAIHGWQDNAGSFDTLIPLLPKHLSYLAIDLQGHGLSSRLPDGVMYGHMDYIYTLNFIFKHHYQWDKVSLMGHSMGALICFTYAAGFPDYVDMLIEFDPIVPFNNIAHLDSLLNGLSKITQSDLRNQQNIEPPSYTYDESVNRLCSGTRGFVTKSTAPYLLRRGIKPSSSDPEKYYFSRDNRLKILNNFFIPIETNIELSKRIKCPFFLLLASPSKKRFQYFEKILKNLYKNEKFEFHKVDGGHHVHLTHPELIDKQLFQFISKYCTEAVPFSKL